ncbi:hypothetical protein COOONC_27533, partial [Cooperia oncophora]
LCNRRDCRTDSGTEPSLSVRHKSFFANSKLPEATIFGTTYFWLREFGSFRTKSFEFGVSRKMLTHWEQYLRRIFTVEIDGTNVRRRKYNRGRRVRRKEWLFGGIGRGSGRAFMVLVKLHSTGNYHHVGLMESVLTAVATASRLQAPDSYMLHFVDPLTGAHTQNIESLRQKFKMIPKKKFGLNTKRYSDYTKEFLWRRKFGKLSKIIFNFFKHVTRLYPC